MTRKILTLIALCLSLTSVQAKGGNSDNGCASTQQDTIKNYIFRVVPSLKSMYVTSVSAWGGGGGTRQTIPTDSGSPFAGRQYGGGDRSTIFGTRAYGSGYPYGANDTSTIAGRPFPYGTWPISFGAYLGGQELIGPTLDVQRPGGPLAVIKVGPANTTSTETYYMIGDRDSVVFMMADLVNWCHATPVWPTTFDPSASGAIKPENVIQYYRASSFALAYSAYNNTFAVSSPSTSQGFGQSTLLPSDIASSPFLQCLNSTIGTALPIIDHAPVSHKLPKYGIALICIFVPLGVAGFLWFLIWGDKKAKENRAKQYNPAPVSTPPGTEQGTELVDTPGEDGKIHIVYQ